jgi:Cu(I)/Ag(I) efflux system membrane fusion protein
MKTKIIRRLSSSVLLVVFGAGIIACTPQESASLRGPGPTEEDNKNTIWTCPMHPQIKKDAAGKCPICGMDLVKAQNLSSTTDQSAAHVPEGHAPFHLANNRIQMIGVKHGVVEKKLLFKSIEAAGRVAFDPELYTAQNEYIEAIKQVERVKEAPLAEVKLSAQRMMESAKLRLKILGLSDPQIARLRAADPSTGANLLITSPGENVWIYAEVFEMDLSSIEAGQEVKITGGSLDNKELIGKVAAVDRVINPSTRTAKVRILIPDGKAFLRPEAFVNTTFLSPLGEQIVIPFDAILDSGKEAWVFVVHDDGHFEPRTVLIKHYAGDEVAVSSGLQPGEKIVTSANFLVDSESRLKGVLSSQAHAPAGEDKKPMRTPPTCPQGQEWHEQMKHCMPKVGG